MICKHHNLSVMAYANNFTLWHYVAEDAVEFRHACLALDWFWDSAKDMIRSGDAIYICSPSNEVVHVRFSVVDNSIEVKPLIQIV